MDSGVSASLGRRLAALVYDGVLVLAIWLCATILHLVVVRLMLGQPVSVVGHSVWAVWSLRALLLIAVTCFFCFFWRRAGMTLGMQAWRLRVQTPQGNAISLKQSLIRCATAWLSLAALGCGYWWVAFDKQRRSWPDIASNTRTIVLPKR